MKTCTVVIVGGGFGGLAAAKTLANQPGIQVLLIDRRNHHLFQPLLYQVATAGLNPGDIAVPIRSQFSAARNVEVHMGEIESVDLAEHIAFFTSSAPVKYDYLILACGAQHSYFGHPEWEDFAPGLKTLEQATEIRRRILSAFERAENETDPAKQSVLMTFLIVGGGPTGVELAGAIADISRTVLLNDFKRVDPSRAKIILVEAGERILSSFSPDLSKRAVNDLRELGVQVLINQRVQQITESGVSLGNETIAAASVFWAAGVQASSLHFTGASASVATDRAGRIKVSQDFSLPHDPRTFVIGDMAAFEWSPGRFLPGLAPVAIQSGRFVGQTILADFAGRTRAAFSYFDKGQMATIGKNRAIVEAGRFRMRGRLAWLVWLFVHIFFLIGFKNRVSVMVQWAWSYIFSKRGARLITERDWHLK